MGWGDGCLRAYVRTPRPKLAGRTLLSRRLRGRLQTGRTTSSPLPLGEGRVGALRGADAPPARPRRLFGGLGPFFRRRLLRAVPTAGHGGLAGRPLPKRFEVVIRPLAREEDVNDDAGVVEHHPRPIVIAGGAQRPHPLCLASFDDRVGDGTHLPVRVALADHEIIGDRALLPDIQPNDAPRLLLVRRIRDEPAELKGGHRPNYPSYHARLSTPGLAEG